MTCCERFGFPSKNPKQKGALQKNTTPTFEHQDLMRATRAGDYDVPWPKLRAGSMAGFLTRQKDSIFDVRGMPAVNPQDSILAEGLEIDSS